MRPALGDVLERLPRGSQKAGVIAWIDAQAWDPPFVLAVVEGDKMFI